MTPPRRASASEASSIQELSTYEVLRQEWSEQRRGIWDGPARRELHRRVWAKRAELAGWHWSATLSGNELEVILELELFATGVQAFE